MEAARRLNSAECEKRGRDAHDGIQRRTSHAHPRPPWQRGPPALCPPGFSQLLFGAFVAPPCLNAEAQACPTVTPLVPHHPRPGPSLHPALPAPLEAEARSLFTQPRPWL